MRVMLYCCKIIAALLFLLLLSRSIILANFTPPRINYSNNIVPYGRWVLDRDQSVNGIVKNSGDFYEVNLNGHLLTIGSDGVNSIGQGQLVIKNGRITASGSQLLLSSSTPHPYQLDIAAAICDAPTHRVGLLVKGTGTYRLLGEHANTFTGDVIVDGRGQYFALAKSDGVTAVSGNIYVKNGAWVGIDSSNQIADSSEVILSGKGAIFGLFSTGRPLTEKFHRLSVDRFDDGILGFYKVSLS